MHVCLCVPWHQNVSESDKYMHLVNDIRRRLFTAILHIHPKQKKNNNNKKFTENCSASSLWWPMAHSSQESNHAGRYDCAATGSRRMMSWAVHMERPTADMHTGAHTDAPCEKLWAKVRHSATANGAKSNAFCVKLIIRLSFARQPAETTTTNNSNNK